MTLGYQKEIVKNWFDRGQALEEGAFDRFIYTWIALNAALSARFPVRGDKRKVIMFGDELVDHWSGLLGSDGWLREATFVFESQSPIYDERPLPDGTLEEVHVQGSDARSVMLGVYAVRNNLFHGSKQFDVERDSSLVRTSSRVVERVFVSSGLYEMAAEPARDLTEPLSIASDGGHGFPTR